MYKKTQQESKHLLNNLCDSYTKTNPTTGFEKQRN